MVGTEFRPQGQEISARGTLGSTNFEQQRVGLIFDLNGMDHPGAVVARLVHQQDRCGADCDEHQKSRQKQQDLP